MFLNYGRSTQVTYERIYNAWPVWERLFSRSAGEWRIHPLSLYNPSIGLASRDCKTTTGQWLLSPTYVVVRSSTCQTQIGFSSDFQCRENTTGSHIVTGRGGHVSRVPPIMHAPFILVRDDQLNSMLTYTRPHTICFNPEIITKTEILCPTPSWLVNIVVFPSLLIQNREDEWHQWRRTWIECRCVCILAIPTLFIS